MSLWNQPIVRNRPAVSAAAPALAPEPEEAYVGGSGPVLQDYTDTGIVDFRDTDIYERAINVSSPRLADEGGYVEDEAGPTIRKKVVRRVEVPFKRKVKVPTTTTKIVPTVEEQRIPVKRLVTVPAFKMVDEQYTVVEEREAVREKEIWVKKIVPEKYIEKVPVKKTRQVRKPTVEVQEVDDYEIVQVPGTKAVEVEGYRIDEVEDTKMVEVEEFQEYEMRPIATNRTYLHQTREVGRIPGSRIATRVGDEVFQQNHPVVRELDEDSNAEAAQRSANRNGDYYNASLARSAQAGGVAASRSAQWVDPNKSYYRPNPNRQAAAQFDPWATSNRSYGASHVNTYNSGSYPMVEGARGSYDASTYTDPKYIRPAGEYKQEAQLTRNPPAEAPPAGEGLGLTVKNTHTRHTDGTGVLVTRIERGGAAARAGLQENDIVRSVNGQPTTTVDEFRQAIKAGQGPLALTLNRDGRQNMGLTLYT